MTAEIIVMNKLAIALAADSAVTIGNIDKVFSSANKLFMLSKHHPVGIMVYANATILDIPWETIIKIYRLKIGKNEKNTILDYTNDFINFLSNNTNLFPIELQKLFFNIILEAHFKQDVEMLNSEIKKDSSRGIDELDEEQIKIKVENHINDLLIINKLDFLGSLNEQDVKQIIKNHKIEIDEVIDKHYQDFPKSRKSRNLLRKYAVYRLTKDYSQLGIDYPINSGIVLAGFGKDDIFPIVTYFSIRSVLDNRLIMSEIKTKKISHTNDAEIIPFAQSDMVSNFMNGVLPNYRKWISSYIKRIYDDLPSLILSNINLSDSDKELIEDKFIKIGNIQYEFFLDIEKNEVEKNRGPIYNIVGVLPKDELAKMAETLVNLTLFKKRISIEPETVGGPIDVAVITKGDGFIWIKRKHYFEKDFNPYFFKKGL